MQGEPMDNSHSSGQVIIRSVIQQTGAEREGHFAIGRVHSGSWISDKLILAKAQQLGNLCRYLAVQVLARADPIPEVVVGLAPDGIALAHALGVPLAAQLMNMPGAEQVGHNFVSLYVDERYVFPKEYEALLEGRNVVVAQSVIYTGKITARIMDAVRKHGGNVMAIAALITRGERACRKIGQVPVIALYDYAPEDWPEKKCPLCARGESYTPIPGKN